MSTPAGCHGAENSARARVHFVLGEGRMGGAFHAEREQVTKLGGGEDGPLMGK